jgi:hypothetical protein
MTTAKGTTFGLALLVSSALTGTCLANTTYNFNYSFPASPGELSISASGTLTVGSGDPIDGFPILSITGSRTVDVGNGPVTMQITGLDPTTGLNSFDGNDNLLFYPDNPVIDFNGISFMVDNAGLSDDGLGDVNVFFAGTDPNSGMDLYTEAAGGVTLGDFEVTSASTDPTPEPSTTMLLICGLLGLAVGKRGSISAFAAARLSQ